MKTRHYLWRLLCFSPWLYTGSFILSLVYYNLPLLVGLIMRAFFNALTGEAEVGFDVWTLMILFFATRLVIQTSEQGYAAVYAYFEGKLKVLLRKNLFQSLLKSPGARTTQSSGEVINRFDDDADGIVAPLATAIELSGHVLSALIALIVMLSINPFITHFAFLPMITIIRITNWMGRRIETYRRANRETTGRVTGFLGELFSAVIAIKVATTEVPAVVRFDVLSEARRVAVLKDNLFNQLLNSMNATTIHLATGVIFIFAGQLMRARTFTVGDFVLFVSYIASSEASVYGFARWTGRLLARIKQAGVSLLRLFELMPDAPRERLVEHGPVHLRGSFPDVPYIAKTDDHRLFSLQVEGLTYRYPDTGRGIEGVNLKLEKGSFVVITGRIGSGKTTLLEVWLGLLPKDSGKIRWNGAIVDDPASFFVPPRCAYTPQVPRLFSDTLEDNILMGLPKNKVDLTAAIHSAVMEQDLTQLENGLDTVIGPRGVRLSGGQAQRTAAARMFVREPELLVFDDLSSALDVETERTLWERIFERKDATCLVVSHRRAALQRADHIIVLKAGRIEAEGTIEELLETCNEMQQLWKGNLGTPSFPNSERTLTK